MTDRGAETPPEPSAMPGDPDADAEPTSDDQSRQMRSEVNAYASAILMKLLAILNDIPAGQHANLAGLDREIRQMLAFIDPARAAWLQEQPPPPERPPAPPAGDPRTGGATVNGAVASILDRLDQLAARDGGELIATLEALRAELQQQHLATTAAVRSLQHEIRALDETVGALATRREQVADLSGIAEERIRVGAWKVALVAGLTGGSLAAAAVAFVTLAA